MRSACLALAILSAGCMAPSATERGPGAANVAGLGGARTVELEYRVHIAGLTRTASGWTAWIPVPSSGRWQTVRDLRWEAPGTGELVADPVYGNRFLRLAGSAPPDGEVAVLVRASVTRRAVRPGDFTGGAGDPAPDERYLAPDRLVPIDGPIAEEASRVIPGAAPPLEAARRLYDHVVATLRYDKSGQGWGQGDALRACDLRTGNCSDFHSLFIGLSRARGVPARFVMGVPLPVDASEGEVAGYHCWAEFHTPEGWRPVDASEASKHPELAGALFSGLDADRVAFSVGRDIPLPGAVTEPLNYAIWPHVEVDGRVHGSVTANIAYRDVRTARSTAAAAQVPPGGRTP